MVIQKFNKLICNKFVWGAFAIIICACFLFGDLFSTSDGDRRGGDGVGTMGGEKVAPMEFDSLVDDVRGFGRSRDFKRPNHEVNRVAWETLAALKVAKANGIESTDEEVAKIIRSDRAFIENGQFNFRRYEQLLRDNGTTPERFEQYLRRRLTVKRVTEDAMEAAAWVSPMELDRVVADRTDVFTVRVAKFKQTPAEAKAVKLTDEGLKKWYEDNTNSLALPDRIKVRYLCYSANDPKVLAKMSPSDDELHYYYDANVDRWTTTDTNGVEQVKTFEQVKAEVDREVRRQNAIEYFETNLTARAYGVRAQADASRLDEIAKADGMKVSVSDYISLGEGYVEGFMKDPESIFPNAEGLVEIVSQLDSSVEDVRYGVVLGKDAVWLIERGEFSPAHVPTFAEAKEIVRPRALAAAKLDAFKAKVEAVAKKGVDEVLKSKDVSTNYVFSVVQMTPGLFPDAYQVVSASSKLSRGEISEFTPTALDTAVLVVCLDRQPGDPTTAGLIRSQIREQLAAFQRRGLPEGWLKWNLERIGFEPSASASVTPAETVDEE